MLDTRGFEPTIFLLLVKNVFVFFQVLYLMSFALELWWIVEAEGKKGVKLCCDSRFQHAFTTCCCVFRVITLVWANQGNYLKTQTHAVNACWKRLSQHSFMGHSNNIRDTWEGGRDSVNRIVTWQYKDIIMWYLSFKSNSFIEGWIWMS